MRKITMVLAFVFISVTVQAELKVWDGSSDLWTDANRWIPVGVPTTNDDVLVTNGMSVLLPGDGVCASFVVTNTGFLIVNDSARTLQVVSNGIVNGSETELRVNKGHLNVGGSVTLFNDATMVLDAVTATATVHTLDLRDGILEWNAGTLRFTDDVYMWSGNPISNLTIETGRTLEVRSPTIFGNELSVGTGGSLTLAGGAVSCDAFAKTAAGTFAFDDGTLTVNGDGFDWDGTTLEVEGVASSNLSTLVLYDFALPTWVILTNGIAIAPGIDGQGHLLVDGYSNLDAPGTLGNGVGSRGSATVTNVSTWKAGTLTVGGAGSGTLTIEDTSRVQDCSKIEVGRDSTSTGIVMVTGSGSQLNSYWRTQIGGHGHAMVQVADGASLSFGDQIGDTEFARYSGSRSEVTVSGPGSQFTITSDAYSHTIYLGLSGHAALTVSNGASVTWDEFARVAETASGRGDIVVTGTNSTWTIDDDIWLGYQGTGTLQVLDGAVARTDAAKLGEFPGGVGLVTVSGAGSVWHGGGYESIGGEFLIGRYGRGELTIEKGGVVHSSGYSELGQYSGSCGYVTVADTGSLWAVSDLLYVGFFGDGVTGRMTVANGGLVTVANTAYLFDGGTIVLNGGAQGSGILDVKTLDLSNGGSIIGDSNGILRVNTVTSQPTHWTIPASLQIGSSNHSGSAHWTLSSGESLTVDVDLCIGYDKSATLIVTNGGRVMADTITVGAWSSSTGNVVNIAGGTLQATNATGTGLLDVQRGTLSLDGGTVVADHINFSSNSFLIGVGVFCGVLTNAGTISPGFSPGTLIVTGSVELLSASQLNVELTGTNALDYDRMMVSGNATLGGALMVTLDGYIPVLADRFDLLDWGTLTPGSTFDTLDLPALPTGREWYTNGLYVDGTLLVSLPLVWLEQYGLSATNDPFGDPDRDGQSTAAEYTADTNPTNGASYFRIDQVDAATVTTIAFDSSSNRMYSLSGCTNMIVDSWDAVPGTGPRMGVGGADSFTDTNEPAKGPYYRLGAELP